MNDSKNNDSDNIGFSKIFLYCIIKKAATIFHRKRPFRIKLNIPIRYGSWMGYFSPIQIRVWIAVLKRCNYQERWKILKCEWVKLAYKSKICSKNLIFFEESSPKTGCAATDLAHLLPLPRDYGALTASTGAAAVCLDGKKRKKKTGCPMDCGMHPLRSHASMSQNNFRRLYVMAKRKYAEICFDTLIWMEIFDLILEIYFTLKNGSSCFNDTIQSHL